MLLEDPCRYDRRPLPDACDGKRLPDVGENSVCHIAVVGPMPSAVESATQVPVDSPRRPMAQAMQVFREQFAILIQATPDDVVDDTDVSVVQLVHHLIALSLVSRWFGIQRPRIWTYELVQSTDVWHNSENIFTSFLVLVVAGSRSRGWCG